MSPLATEPVGVVGAGTMGEGIAQVAASAGHVVLLHDSRPGAAMAARDRIADRLARQVARGKLAEASCAKTLAALRPVEMLADLAPAGLVIEAIVEDLAVKQALFVELESLMRPEAVLATNTSSISVTAIAAALARPGRFAGLHFFNPAPVMTLVEIVSGLATDQAIAEALGKLMPAWGKVPVRTASTPGFIVNRVARPFYAEALRLLQERTAEPAVIDAVLRGGGGFRMGPFALMDLIGNDVNFAVTSSMHRAWHGEPRYQPSVVQSELVAAGRLGRKSGRGFFDYDEGTDPSAVEPPVPERAAPARVTAGRMIDRALVERLTIAGIELVESDQADDALMWDGVRLCETDGRSATERAQEEGRIELVLFDLVPDWHTGTAIAIAGAEQGAPEAIEKAAGLFAAIGLEVHIVEDRPGLVVARTWAMLANEAAEAALHAIATPADIDKAMRLGANYPLGPLALCNRIGARRVVRLLDHLAAAYGEDRYRASSLLRRMAAATRIFDLKGA